LSHTTRLCRKGEKRQGLCVVHVTLNAMGLRGRGIHGWLGLSFASMMDSESGCLPILLATFHPSSLRTQTFKPHLGVRIPITSFYLSHQTTHIFMYTSILTSLPYCELPHCDLCSQVQAPAVPIPHHYTRHILVYPTYSPPITALTCFP